jgi:hypothetical protein
MKPLRIAEAAPFDGGEAEAVLGQESSSVLGRGGLAG